MGWRGCLRSRIFGTVLSSSDGSTAHVNEIHTVALALRRDATPGAILAKGSGLRPADAPAPPIHGRRRVVVGLIDRPFQLSDRSLTRLRRSARAAAAFGKWSSKKVLVLVPLILSCCVKDATASYAPRPGRGRRTSCERWRSHASTANHRPRPSWRQPTATGGSGQFSGFPSGSYTKR